MLIAVSLIIIGIVHLIWPSMLWRRYRPAIPPPRFHVPVMRILAIWIIIQGLYLAGVPIDRFPPLKYLLVPIPR